MDKLDNKLFKAINESVTHEMGEMAQKPMGEATFRPIYVDDESGQVVVGEKKFLEDTEHHKIGYLFHDKVAVLFTCGDDDFNKFFEENQSIVEELEQKFGDNVGFTNLEMPCYKKRAKPFELTRSPNYGEETFMTPDMRMAPPKSSRQARTWILDGGNFTADGEHDRTKGIPTAGLYRLISAYFEEPKIANHLSKCGIPQIVSGDENREFLNRHGEISNNKIEYGTLHYHLYDTTDEFINAVVRREESKAGDIKVLSTHLARQFNKKYPKWDPRKMSKDEYKGLTDIYMLNRVGLQQLNPQITVRLDFKILGHLNPASKTYFWKIIFKTRFGEKAKEEFYLNTFTVDKDFEVKKTVKFTPKFEFDDEHPVLFQPEIYKGLETSMKEMRDKILSIVPLDSSNLVSKESMEKYQKKAQETLSENELVKRLTDNILREIISNRKK